MESVVVKREMGFTRDDFFSRLGRAFADFDYIVNGDGATIQLPRGSLQIMIGEQRERKLSENVCFPVLPVTMQFDNVDTETRERLLHRFNISYQKGLG